MTKYTQSNGNISVTVEDLTCNGTQVGNKWYYIFINPSNDAWTEILSQATEITEEEYKTYIGV